VHTVYVCWLWTAVAILLMCSRGYICSPCFQICWDHWGAAYSLRSRLSRCHVVPVSCVLFGWQFGMEPPIRLSVLAQNCWVCKAKSGYNSINSRQDATITNLIDNYNQLNMFQAIISPILRALDCVYCLWYNAPAMLQHRRCICECETWWCMKWLLGPCGINILMCICTSNYDLAWKNRRASLGNLDIGREVYLLWCYYSFARFVRGNVLRQICYNIFCKHNAGRYEWLGFLFCHITQEPSVDGGGSLSSLYFVYWSYPFFQQTSWGLHISDRQTQCAPLCYFRPP